MKNILENVKKQLKHGLKNNKNLSYSKGLALTFLMTGSLINASENQDLSAISKNLQKKIQKLRSENKKKLKYSRLELERLEKEGDQVIKSPWDSYILSSFSSFKDMDKKDKNWRYGDRQDTSQDIERAIIRRVLGLSERKGGTTGWITETNTSGSETGNAWTNNANIYDNTAEFAIIPTIKIPEVTMPLTPQVNLPTINAPVVPNAPSINISTVNVGSVTMSVTPPTIPSIAPTISLTSPNDVDINVVSPNMNITVDEVKGPEIKEVNQPTISFTPPSLNIAPQVPPRISVPSPTVNTPNSPTAPSFTAFRRGRGDWLGGYSFIQGANNFNRNIRAWEQSSNGPSLRHINNQPMFNVGGVIKGDGKTSASKIIATTSASRVVTNRYDNIYIMNGAAGGNPTDQYGLYPLTEISAAGFPAITPGAQISAIDNGSLSGNANSVNNTRYQQSWIFQGSPVVEDLSIEVGGPFYASNDRSTAIFAQTNSIVMNRVALTLAGRSIVGEVTIRDAYKVNFNSLDINITGNSNSILTTKVYPNVHAYHNSIRADLRTNWGASYLDNVASTTGIDFGGTTLKASTSENAILYVSAVEMHRWLGTSQMVPYPNETTPLRYDINSEKYYIYSPIMGNMNLKNTGGNVTFVGSGNVGVWVAAYVPDRTKWMGANGLKPSLDLGVVELQGDKNVGFYLADHKTRPDANGIFQGDINVTAKLGTDIDGSGGSTQIGTGNISGNSNTKSEDNVAIYIASGQRSEMNNILNGYKQYFPATLDFKVDTITYPGVVGINNGTQIGFDYLSADPINNLSVSKFNLEFGKFSKNGIGMIVKNGSVVNVNKGSTISDNAGTGTDRATGTVMFYADGVWFNPRKATNLPYNKESYGRGESVTGQKNIVDFNSTVNVNDDISMTSYEGVAYFAKDGAKITGKNVTMNGYGSIAAFAYGHENTSSTVLSNNTGTGTQAKTSIVVSNIKATTTGSKNNPLDGSNSNLGAVAMSGAANLATAAGTSITVNGTVEVNGVGAYADGKKAEVKIIGNTSNINTGENGALVALKGGLVEFGGGSIVHKIADKVAFYSDAKNGTIISTVDFKGATTIDMHKGIAFYGSKGDFDGTTGRYMGMSNVTVNLRDNGVNLGYFEYAASESDAAKTLNWSSSAVGAYMNGLKARVGGATINDNGYWFKSALDGAIVNIVGNVRLDYASDDPAAAGNADKFNDITMERSKVIIDSGITVNSVTTGNGLKIASNNKGLSNAETGYTIKGTVDIKGGTGENVGAYVSFGHINNTGTGSITVNKGVGAYGVNGTQILNEGIIKISEKTSATKGGIGLVGVTRRVKSDGTVDTPEDYGTDSIINNALPLVDIMNKGKINIYSSGTTISDNATGIFAENNIGGLRGRVKVHNEGDALILGDESVGIMIKATSGYTEGGTLTLKHKSSVTGADIKVGATSFGISVDYSDVKLDGNYTIEMGRESVALNLTGNSSITTTSSSDILNINYDYTDTDILNNPKYGTGIYYTGKINETLTNNLNLTLRAAGGILDDQNALVGIYAAGTETAPGNITKLNNSGNISVGMNDYGIYGKNIYITNTGNIEVKDNGIGILSSEGRVTTTDNLIKVTGANGIGIYASGTHATNNRDILINSSSNKLEVSGEEGIGVYLDGTSRLDNKGTIELTNSNTVGISGDIIRKIGVYLKDSSVNNVSSGVIKVNKDNIGVYALNSNFRNDTGGLISVDNTSVAQNIGVYAITSDDTIQNEFTLINGGTIEVNGLKNIGIYTEIKDSALAGDKGLINLSSGKINVTASNPTVSTDIPLGVYGKGDNITVSSTSSQTKVSENAVGIYLDGKSNLGKGADSFIGEFLLKSAPNSTAGIGAYLKGGAQALTGTIKVLSSNTGLDTSGNPIRPIGIFYGQHTGSLLNGVNVSLVNDGINLNQETIGIYGESLSDITNTGNINITSNSKGIGMYFKDSNLQNTGNITIDANASYGLYLKSDGVSITNSTNTGNITINKQESVGLVLDDKAELKNTGIIDSKAGALGTQSGSIGVYIINEGSFVNESNGSILATVGESGGNAGSVGIYAKNGFVTNKGLITSAYLGIYGEKDTSVSNSVTKIDHEGNLLLTGGIGAYIKDAGTKLNLKAGGTLTSSTAGISGIIAYDKAEINLDGTNIDLTGANSNGIILGNNTGITDKSQLNLNAGNITVGSSGIGIYSKNGKINIGSSYTGELNLGAEGVGIFADKDTEISAGEIKVLYSDTTNRGVGIFYDGGSQDNKVSIGQDVSNKNLINIYGQNINLINNADQEVTEKGIGIYVKGTSLTPSTLENNSLLSLTGSESVGIVAATDSVITKLGKITGSDGNNEKIGVYVDGGNIVGNSLYEFGVAGGIGLYLSNTISYTGTIDITSGLDSGNHRTIGILTPSSFGTNNLDTNVDLNGSGAIGLYQESGTNLTYGGKLNLQATSTDANQGIGVYLKNGSIFNLGATGEVIIAGTSNIGFFVESGANLNITGGTVSNTEEGIFAYLDGGTMTFTSSSMNINYANVIVDNGGTLTNQTTIITGRTGLQAKGLGSTILNDNSGIINSSTVKAVAMTGQDDAHIDNKGIIDLSADESIGMYVERATGVSSGEVRVNEKSVAYYANDTGGELTITGTSVLGKNSTLLAVANGGKINYQSGAINLGNERYGALISGSGSIIDFGNNDISVGEKSVAVMLENGGAIDTSLKDIYVGKDGVGIYLVDNTNIITSLTRKINLGENATGIYGENGGNILSRGEVLSSSDGAKGLASKNVNTVKIENDGTIDLAGKASVGVYGEGIDEIKNNVGKLIKVGESNTVTGKASVGIFGVNTNNILNEGTIEFGETAVGIYGENITGKIENISSGLLTNNNGIKGTGIFGKNSIIENRGDILLGESSNGIYSENGEINNYGNVIVGDEKSAGLFASGTGDINHISGEVRVGANSVGLATENGRIINNSIINSTGTGTTYIYSVAGEGINNTLLDLTDGSVGMYGQAGIMRNNNTIKVGKSTISTSEFSVGMATETGLIVNESGSVIDVSKESGVGMFASGIKTTLPDGTVTFGPSGRGENHGYINVNGLKAYGMLGTNGAEVYNDGTIDVNGTGAKGIVGTNEAQITNTGTINVNGNNAQGIYIEKGATLTNTGQINVIGTGSVGIYVGMGSTFVNYAGITVSAGTTGQAILDGGGTLANIGDIVIDGPTASLNGITVSNVGTIEITGSLDFTGNIVLDTVSGQAGTINIGGLTGTGHIILSPTATLGNNHDMHHVQLLGGLNNPETDTIRVTSQSVSFLAEKYFDQALNSYVLTLTRIPYATLLKNTEAVEFGKGLDYLHTQGISGKEMDMFDALKGISDKDELAETFDMELRGNVYSNIQQRMMDVDGVLDSAYEQLKREENPSKDATKVSAIISGGNISDKNAGVEEYDYTSLGIMYLKEKETVKYGQNFNYSLGILQSKFDFDQDSKEDVTSIKAGVGYEQYLWQNSRFKFQTRGELGLNYHDMERKIHLSNGTYTNKGDYFSGTAQLKNRMNYELPIISKNAKVDVYGSLNMGYGKYQGFKEDGDGMYLDIKSNDYFSVRPGVGVEGELSHKTPNGHKWMLLGGASYEYETADIYGDGNEVKIANTDAGYYRLEKPKKIEDILKANVGIGFETVGGFKVGGKVERTEGSVDGTKYQLDFSWKF